MSAHAYQEEETATGVGASFLVDLIPELTPVVRPVARTAPRRRRRIRPERVVLSICAFFGVLGFSLGILARPLRLRAIEAEAASVAVVAAVPRAAPVTSAVVAPEKPVVVAKTSAVAPRKVSTKATARKATARKATSAAKKKPTRKTTRTTKKRR